MQMAGMLIGGILWGILGDRRGRLSVLFGSILIYSVANIANGFVTDVTTYAVLRFVAGVGLAGRARRGRDAGQRAALAPRCARLGTTVDRERSASAARCWRSRVGRSPSGTSRTAIGGVLGLLLLALRVGVLESRACSSACGRATVSRGNFLALFSNARRARRYAA